MRITKDPETRRAELIAAARELFDKNGIEKTQISQIVKKVGVAQGLFYYYFPSKEDMVNQVLQVVNRELEEETEQILQGDVSFYEKLRRYIRLYLRLIDQFSGDQEDNLSSMLDIIQRNPLAKQAHRQMVSTLEKLLVLGVTEGALKLRYPEAMGKMMLYGLLQLSRESLMDREQLADMIRQGLQLPENSLDLGHKKEE